MVGGSEGYGLEAAPMRRLERYLGLIQAMLPLELSSFIRCSASHRNDLIRGEHGKNWD